MNEKPIKIIEICFAGSNSIGGTIFNEHGIEVVKRMNEYEWVILANPPSFDMLEDECKSLKIESYVIADRLSARVSKIKK